MSNDTPWFFVQNGDLLVCPRPGPRLNSFAGSRDAEALGAVLLVQRLEICTAGEPALRGDVHDEENVLWSAEALVLALGSSSRRSRAPWSCAATLRRRRARTAMKPMSSRTVKVPVRRASWRSHHRCRCRSPGLPGSVAAAGVHTPAPESAVPLPPEPAPPPPPPPPPPPGAGVRPPPPSMSVFDLPPEGPAFPPCRAR